ncbi:MAG: DMT family transporter [Bacteroidota bacterium]
MNKTAKIETSFWIIGLVFSALWASASVASKIALQSAQPFVISLVRFCMASLVMLVLAHGILKRPLPTRSQWKQLVIFGLLNVALYLGFFILAIGQVSAGLGTIALALNPVLITVLYSLLNRKSPSFAGIFSLALGFCGVMICAYPLLVGSHATITGIFLLFLSMLVYSLGTIYFQKSNWQNLDMITINGWQTFFGAFFTLPAMLLFWKGETNHFDAGFWSATGWLAIVVSIVAVQSWIYLLRHYHRTAVYWLFLSPIFGFFYSNWLTGETIGILTIIGTILVLTALAINVRNKQE